jgi:exonuclease VII large subunit
MCDCLEKVLKALEERGLYKSDKKKKTPFDVR